MAKPVWQGQHVVEQIKAQRPLYRYAATGLGASMWFFVCWKRRVVQVEADKCTADVQSEGGWAGVVGMEASLGSLIATSDENEENHTSHNADCTYLQREHGRRINGVNEQSTLPLSIYVQPAPHPMLA